MKRRDLRILLNTNGIHANSGYSIEARDLMYRLVKDGWPVAISSFYGIQGGPTDIVYPSHLNPKLRGLIIKHYPVMSESWGSDGMYFHSRDFKAHVTMSLQDVWVLDPNYLSKITWIPWFPVDKDPLPLNVREKLNFAYKVLCFSKFGQEQLLKHGFSSTLIYEGTDVEIFQPRDKIEARKKLGLQPTANNLFIWSMVGANKENPPRKGFQEAITAFKMFQDKHPDSAILFHVQQRSPGGFPIKEYANQIGVKNVLFMDDYKSMFMSTSDMIAMEYNACDALLHPSQTEGFGLGIIEAQASGKPVVIQNCQSQPELIIEGKTGFGASTMYKRFTNDLSYVNVADPKSVYECMEKVYKMVKDDEKKVEKDCRSWVVKNFNIDTIVHEKWIPLLTDLQDTLIPLTSQEKSSNMNLIK